MQTNNYLRNKVQSPGYRNKAKKPYDGAIHTPSSQKGLGDYYGTGIVAKLGKMRSGSVGMEILNPNQLKQKPRSLA